LNQRLLAAVAAATLFASAAASAQGLPFSSDASTDRPWSVNRMPTQDPHVFRAHPDQAQSDQSAASQNGATTSK
jgi:hypothetical protein